MAGQMADLTENPADGSVAYQTIAAFEVPNTTDGPGEFDATIDWGDGSTSAGVVSGGGGLFQIAGSHQYTTADAHVLQITVDQGWGARLRVTQMAQRAGPPVYSHVYPFMLNWDEGRLWETLQKIAEFGQVAKRSEVPLLVKMAEPGAFLVAGSDGWLVRRFALLILAQNKHSSVIDYLTKPEPQFVLNWGEAPGTLGTLVTQLGDDAFLTRQAAQKTLIAMNNPDVGLYLAAYLREPKLDFEIADRGRTILAVVAKKITPEDQTVLDYVTSGRGRAWAILPAVVDNGSFQYEVTLKALKALVDLQAIQ